MLWSTNHVPTRVRTAKKHLQICVQDMQRLILGLTDLTLNLRVSNSPGEIKLSFFQVHLSFP